MSRKPLPAPATPTAPEPEVTPETSPESLESTEATEATGPEVVASSLPTDAVGWRALITSLPAKELLRILQQDKVGSAMRILMGFRPGGEALRHPVVLQRLVEEAMKQPKFAEKLGELRPIAPHPVVEKTASPPRVAEPTPTREDSPALKETVKRQRTALKEKDGRITELEAQLVALTRERDAARAELESAQNARRTAEAEADRQKRQRERDARRPAPREESGPKEKTFSVPMGTAPVLPPQPRPFEEAAQRLLNRGKYSVVAELCGEALQTDAITSGKAIEGRVHSLYAAALYGMADPTAEEQDRIAINTLLDGGRIVEAAEATARLLTRAFSIKAADSLALRRLLLLAERTGDSATVQEVFTHMRIGSAESGRRLRAALAGSGKKSNALLDAALGTREGVIVLGPDEAIALPVTNPIAASVTPRRIMQAVDGGDAVFVQAVRIGLRALRARGDQGSQLTDALLEAVTALEPVAVAPFLAEETQPILVDASNVARHNPDPLALSPPPRVGHLLLIRDYLLRQGFFPVLLIADATLRFHVDDRNGYQSLLEKQIVRETPPGTSADESLLMEARARRAPLVTNDRFGEWGDAAAGIERYGFLLTPGRVALTSGI